MIITLTSDIGLQDYLVGAAKGLLCQDHPTANVVDISHHLTPFNYPQAAYICRNAIKYFPSFSFNIILLNLFEQTPVQLLLAKHNDQYWLCADNGLLTMILEGKPATIISLSAVDHSINNLLDCIKCFSKAIRQINKGLPLLEVGYPAKDIIEKKHIQPVYTTDGIEAQIIFIDNFENVVLNITKDQFEAQRLNRSFSIAFRRNEYIQKISETYADVPEGEKLALFNAAGYLEIAINKGNAAGLLFGLHGYKDPANNAYLQNHLFYQTVKIFFE
jgi:S-adenosyl-L-methionine hydrolase (adenosine-forming)